MLRSLLTSFLLTVTTLLYAQNNISYHAIHFKGSVVDLSGDPHHAGIWFYDNEDSENEFESI